MCMRNVDVDVDVDIVNERTNERTDGREGVCVCVCYVRFV